MFGRLHRGSKASEVIKHAGCIHFWLLCSSRNNSEGHFLFKLPDPNIYNSTYYIWTLRRLQKLLLSKYCSSLPVANITCKAYKCILHEKDAMLHFQTNGKIILKTDSRNGFQICLHAESLCAASKPFAFTALWLWCIFMIIEDNYCSNVYLWTKAITPETSNRCRLYMLESVHYLTSL